MRIKIISNGEPGQTRVVNAETGEPIERVAAVDWHVHHNDLAVAQLTIESPELEGDAFVYEAHGSVPRRVTHHGEPLSTEIVGEASILRLRPGDLLAVKARRVLPKEVVDRLRGQMLALLERYGHKDIGVMLLDPSIDLQVVRTEDAAG